MPAHTENAHYKDNSFFYHFIKGNMFHKSAIIRIILGTFAGLFVALNAYAYILVIEAGQFSAAGNLFNTRPLRLIFLICCFMIIGALIAYNSKRFFQMLFKYRWFFAVGLIILLTALQLSGSSIGYLLNTIGVKDSLLAGINRPIRSDEWALFTPMQLSQCYGDTPFSYFQDYFRATSTDMFAIYGAPVLNPLILFRPFQLGYILFGSSIGLSFFWNSRLILLFMMSFEFSRYVLVKQSKPLALAYALLLTFSGGVQWWFSINSLVEMLVFGQLGVLLAYFYIFESSWKKKILLGLAIGYCLEAFLLTLYPAWEIPFGWFFLLLVIALCIKYRKNIRFAKRDYLLFCSIVLAVVGIFCCFLLQSHEAIAAESQTVYPGSRNSLGGGDNIFADLFRYINYFISPLTPNGLFANESEDGVFFSFFPLSIVLAVIVLIKNKKADSFIILTLCYLAFIALYLFYGFPSWLAKISLFSSTWSNRVVLVLNFCLFLLFFYSLARMEKTKKATLLSAGFLSYLVLMAGYIYWQRTLTQNPPNFTYMAYTLFLSGILFFMIAFIKTKKGLIAFSSACLVAAYLGGVLVNPVRQGLGSYYNNSTYTLLKENSQDDDTWATLNSSWLFNNYLPSIQLKTINSTNTYPNFDLWRILDPEGVYEEAYNRYAHITIELSDETSFESPYPDQLKVSITPEDLKKLGVTKVASTDATLPLQKIGENVEGSPLTVYSLE